MRQVGILGTRGIPAQHGGFETFAENLALYLVEKGWEITVYCQQEGNGRIYEDRWFNVQRVHIPVSQKGAKGTVVFDWKATLHAASRKIPVLTLGYNTALFCTLYRFRGMKNIINMDGIEWRRSKWNALERSWLYMNEKIGAWLGNHLIADHPQIKEHLSRFVSSEKISVIPYGADIITSADTSKIAQLELEVKKYAILIARPEPENSVLEIVKAFSRIERGIPLVILGNLNPQSNEYHQLIISEASQEIRFLGAIYDKKIVQALRFFARFYIHGHTVGGTNPSLVEALGAGSAVLAHNNVFNRWVAGEGAHYFSSEDECAQQIELLISDDDLIKIMKHQSYEQIENNFSWDKIFATYEQTLVEKIF